MVFRSDTADRSGIGTHLSQLADGIGKLVAHHLQLARLELTDDAKAAGAIVAKMAVYVPFVVVGYALLCAALAFALTA